MSTRRIRLQAESQRRELLLALQRLLSSWLQDWSVHSDLLRVRTASRLADVPATHRWQIASTALGQLWMAGPSYLSDSLGAWLTAAAPGDSLGLAERVGIRAKVALLASLLAGPESALSIVDGPAPDNGGFECYCFEIETPGEALYLVLDWQLADRIALPPQASSQSVLPRESALDSARVRFDVMLDLGGASLAETNGLCVGDVLVSRTPLDAVFQLSHPDSRPIATGRLFKKDTSRAIRLEGTSATGKHQ